MFVKHSVITRLKVGYFEKFAITEPTAYVLLVGWLIGWLAACVSYMHSLLKYTI